MFVCVERAGRIVARSRNLRGILDYARRSLPARVEIVPLPEGKGSLRVIFRDGATTRANFESLEVLREWVKARRSWAGATVHDYGRTGPYHARDCA